MQVQVIKEIEQFGPLVDIIVSDNYPLNVGNSKEILARVQHPNNIQRSLYMMFNFAHIIKSNINNWLNQKDFNCTYTFPHYEDILHSNYPMRLSQAAFQVIISQLNFNYFYITTLQITYYII